MSSSQVQGCRLTGLELTFVFQPPASISPGHPFPRPVVIRLEPYIQAPEATDSTQNIPQPPPEEEFLHFEFKFIRHDHPPQAESTPSPGPFNPPGGVRMCALIDTLSDRFNIILSENNIRRHYSVDEMNRHLSTGTGRFYIWCTTFRAVRVPGAYRLQVLGYLKRKDGSTELLARTESDPIHVSFYNMPIESPESMDSFLRRVCEYDRGL
jgi:hypothetical protein